MSSMVSTAILGVVPVLGRLGTWGRCCRQILPFTLIVLFVAVGACSAAGSPPGAQPAGTSAPARPAPPPELASFCAAAPDLLQVLDEGPDIAPPGAPADVATALQTFSTRFEPPLTAVLKNMPAVVQDDIGTLGRQARAAVATKTVAPMNTPEFFAALTRFQINTVKQCAIPEIRVVATEYKYDGIPSNVAAGPLSVILINLGAEPHEMKVFRIPDGESQPFTALIGLSQAERDKLLTAITPTLSANPGSTDSEILKLAPGRYGVACFKSQGATLSQDGTGPSHASLGEEAEFTVQ